MPCCCAFFFRRMMNHAMKPIKAIPKMGPTTAPAIHALLFFFSGPAGVIGVGRDGGAVAETELVEDCGLLATADDPKGKIISSVLKSQGSDSYSAKKLSL